MIFNKSNLVLYAITDRTWLKNDTLENKVELALLGGATMVQLREKNLDENSFLQEAKKIQAVCHKYKVPFIINDNVELAVKINADGIHVGQEDMDAKDVRSIIGSQKILGVSAQTVEQALYAQKMGADYLGVGAVFKTSSKDAPVLDFKTVKDICNSVTIPVVAIGGIKKENISQLKDLGFAGISVISAIFAEQDIKQATQSLKLIAQQIFTK